MFYENSVIIYRVQILFCLLFWIKSVGLLPSSKLTLHKYGGPASWKDYLASRYSIGLYIPLYSLGFLHESKRKQHMLLNSTGMYILHLAFHHSHFKLSGCGIGLLLPRSAYCEKWLGDNIILQSRVAGKEANARRAVVGFGWFSHQSP